MIASDPGLVVAVDAGNTETAAALYDETGRRLAHRRNAPLDDLDEAGAFLEGLLEGARPAAAGIASVRPASTAPLAAALESRGATVSVLRADALPGLRLDVDRPDEVGIDRAVNAWIAAGRLGRPSIVVDLGTATTIDVVGPDGAFRGGAIAPGLAVGLSALLERAALLRGRFWIEDLLAVGPVEPVGRSSAAALRAGALLGHAAMIDGLVHAARSWLGEKARVAATGGLAGIVAPHCREIDLVEPFLTLDGVAAIVRAGGGAA